MVVSWREVRSSRVAARQRDADGGDCGGGRPRRHRRRSGPRARAAALRSQALLPPRHLRVPHLDQPRGRRRRRRRTRLRRLQQLRHLQQPQPGLRVPQLPEKVAGVRGTHPESPELRLRQVRDTLPGQEELNYLPRPHTYFLLINTFFKRRIKVKGHLSSYRKILASRTI